MNSDSLPTPPPSPSEPIARLPRRTVLKWLAATAAALHLPEVGAESPIKSPSTPSSQPVGSSVKGYGSDPDLSKFYQPGDFWPLTLTPAERRATTAFADLLFPADHLGPSASTVRVPDYLDEWISAPYPIQRKDRETIISGLQWLDAEAQKRFAKPFADLVEEQQKAIADDICWPPDAKMEFKKAAAFFIKFRSLAASAYFGTEPGWKALGYVGNTPLAQFDGPPPEVLAQLGVEQTVT